MKRTLWRYWIGIAVGSVAMAQPQTEERFFPVSEIVLVPGSSHPSAPALASLGMLEIPLHRSGGDWVAAGPGSLDHVQLGAGLPAGGRVGVSAVKAIAAGIVTSLNRKGHYGVLVAPDPNQIDPQSMEDLRPAGDLTLRLMVWFSEVSDVRTVGKGARVGLQGAVDSARHSRIARHSPLKPAAAGEHGSLLSKPLLDDYLRRLNRHPGRTVEAAISATDEPGKVVLDYLITENRPWFVYGQVSNTGTKATDELRERVGVVHNQVFGWDDTASLDYVTSNFDTANAVFGSYSVPIVFPDKLRARAYGSWGDFNATTPTLNTDHFTGSSWVAGLELISSPLRFWGTSLDVTLGIAWQKVEVLNEATKFGGEADLITPSLSFRLYRSSPVFGFDASVGYETNIEKTEQQDLVRLGRLNTTSDYKLVRGELTVSSYLEPLFFGISRENSWKRSTLAHEVTFSARGQVTLGNDRLIPQKEQAIGGFFTVRGYPESVVAGDEAASASLEYRFHLPRALRPASEDEGTVDETGKKQARREEATLFGRPFNGRPPRIYAQPDWDFILRAFADCGVTRINRRQIAVGEHNHSLMSIGGGLELQFRRLLNARVDVGYALKEAKTGFTSASNAYTEGYNDVDSGDLRAHFLITLLW